MCSIQPKRFVRLLLLLAMQQLQASSDSRDCEAIYCFWCSICHFQSVVSSPSPSLSLLVQRDPIDQSDLKPKICSQERGKFQILLISGSN